MADINSNEPLEEDTTDAPATTDPEVATGSQNPGAPLQAADGSTDFLPGASVVNKVLGIAERQVGEGSLNNQQISVDIPDPIKAQIFKNVNNLNDTATTAGNAVVGGLQTEAKQNIISTNRADIESQAQTEANISLEKSENTKQLLNQSVNDFNDLQDATTKFINLPNQGIDPTRYVDNLGVSGKTLTALGMIVGGYGAGLTGGQNTAVQVFQQRVQNDIQAQTVSNQQHLLALSQAQGVATGRVQLASIANTAQSISTHNVLTGIAATLQNDMVNAQNQNQYQAASAMYFKVQQDLAKNENDYARTFAGSIQNQDNYHAGLGGYAAAKAAKNIREKTPVGPAPAPTPPPPADTTEQPQSPVPEGYRGYIRNQ
jgi:hypothetical protein